MPDPQAGNPALSLPVILSPTRVELAARCERRHLLSDYLHLETYKSPSTAFGTQVHLGVHARWRSWQAGDTGIQQLDASLTAALASWPEEASGGYHSPELARTLLTNYMADGKLACHSPHPQDEYVILAMEERMHAPLGPDMVLSFQVDRLLLHEPTDTLLIVDTKTSARPDERWARGMRRSVQQRAYNALIAQAYGRTVGEHYVEAFDKKSMKRATIYERLDTFWTSRYVGEALDLAYTMAARDLHALQSVAEVSPDGQLEVSEHDLMRWAATEASFNYQDCYSYYVECEFLGVCDASPDERVALLADGSTFMRGEPWQADVRADLDAQRAGART